MLRIQSSNGRVSDYARSYLAAEARNAVKVAPDSDGKVRGWYVSVNEGTFNGVRLCVDYLTRDGAPRTHHVVL